MDSSTASPTPPLSSTPSPAPQTTSSRRERENRREKSSGVSRLQASIRHESAIDDEITKQLSSTLQAQIENERSSFSKSLEIPPSATRARRSELLDVVSDLKIKAMGIVSREDFPLPRFIIVGKQSVGKSRLIEAFAGEQFNFVSGTLGSRRPTVLEFKNNPTFSTSKWFVRDASREFSWVEKSLSEIMSIVYQAHESLGTSVSVDPVHIRLESSDCVDMQVVDLPGFRDFSLDADKEQLAKQIEDLNMSFVNDSLNFILCVEEAGDAANMSSLMRCMKVDPDFSRTILIRNKLDKYYKDLNSENINQWADGYGDLPEKLVKFALTLPHDKAIETGRSQKKTFANVRDEISKSDVMYLRNMGLKPSFLNSIGFEKFAKYVEKKMELLFVNSFDLLKEKLTQNLNTKQASLDTLQQEEDMTNPGIVTATIARCGLSFAHALENVMEGQLSMDRSTKYTLEDELVLFHQKYANNPDMNLLPACEFASLSEYLDFLRHSVRLPYMDNALNGGAQFRRLLIEVEVFLRFAAFERPNDANHHNASSASSTIADEDILQARGITQNLMSWKDVILKLLNSLALSCVKKKVKYIGHRFAFFFEMQKEAVLDFMKNLKSNPQSYIFSNLYTQHYQLIASNPLFQHAIFRAYDNAVKRQREYFEQVFLATLIASLANPFQIRVQSQQGMFAQFEKLAQEDFSKPKYLQKKNETDMIGSPAYAFKHTCSRIPIDVESKGHTEGLVDKWINQIPVEYNKIDKALLMVRVLIHELSTAILDRSATQTEIFAEAFFKIPMLRKLEEFLTEIDLDDLDKDTYRTRRTQIKELRIKNESDVKLLTECVDLIKNYQVKTQAKLNDTFKIND